MDFNPGIKKRAASILAAIFTVLAIVQPLIPAEAEASSNGKWVLVETYQYPVPEELNETGYIGRIDLNKNEIEARYSWPWVLGPYSSKDYSDVTDMHATYRWQSPPSVISAEEYVNIQFSQQAISNKNGDYSIGFRPGLSMDQADLEIWQATSSKVNGEITYQDGTVGRNAGIGYGYDPQAQGSFTANVGLEFRGAGTPGQRHALYFKVYTGSRGSIGVRYTYEWQESNVEFPYTKASSWAVNELNQAYQAGVTPSRFENRDVTRNITREEFAELAVRLYEATTGMDAPMPIANPFRDTSSPAALKAYELGITTGTSATTFSPNEILTREQCATMFYRAIQIIAPYADYSVAGVPDFRDQRYIAPWAVEGTKYMYKIGIIKGDQYGNFMPNQKASQYGTASIEASLSLIHI